MMIDSALKMLEYLLKFRDRRSDEGKRMFSTYVEPTYRLAELIFRDYLKVLTDLKRMAEDGASRVDLIRFIEDKRLENLPIRMKIRALLRKCAPEDWLGEEQGRFEKGLWGLMLGGLGGCEDNALMNSYNPYQSGRHTLLDLLYEVELEDNQTFLRLVEIQTQALTEAWEDVTAGYVDLQAAAHGVTQPTFRTKR